MGEMSHADRVFGGELHGLEPAFFGGKLHGQRTAFVTAFSGKTSKHFEDNKKYKLSFFYYAVQRGKKRKREKTVSRRSGSDAQR